MRFLIAALPLFFAQTAASHTLEVRILKGKATYAQIIKLEEDRNSNFDGPVGRPSQQMTVGAILSRAPAKPGEFQLQYQAQLSGAGGGGLNPTSFQVNGSISLRPGMSVTAVDCGGWKLELSLDGAAGKKDSGGSWDSGGLDNYRLTVDLASPGSDRRCRRVMRSESQSILNDGGSMRGRNYYFSMNAALQSSGPDGVGLNYQIESAPLQGMPFRTMSQDTLAWGRKSSAQGKGYSLDFLIEGNPSSRTGTSVSAPAPAAAPAPAPEESKAVPLLR